MRGDGTKYFLHLTGGTDQGPDMLGRIDAIELDDTGACDAVDRLAGCIRNEMQMKAPLFFADHLAHRCAHPVGEMSIRPHDPQRRHSLPDRSHDMSSKSERKMYFIPTIESRGQDR